MNNAEELADIIQDANRRNMPEVMEGLMAERPTVAMWVADALAETAALRKLLAGVSDARDVKAAKAIAARAAKVPAIEDPRLAANRKRIEARKAYNILEERIAAEKERRAKAERVEAARRELARIEAERKHEEELRALIAEADGTRITDEGVREPPKVDPADIGAFRIEH